MNFYIPTLTKSYGGIFLSALKLLCGKTDLNTGDICCKNPSHSIVKSLPWENLSSLNKSSTSFYPWQSSKPYSYHGHVILQISMVYMIIHGIFSAEKYIKTVKHSRLKANKPMYVHKKRRAVVLILCSRV